MKRARSIASAYLPFALAWMLGPVTAAADGIYQSEKHAFRLVTVTHGLERPWGLAFLPEGGMLVTEKAGALRRIAAGGEIEPQPIAGVPEVVSAGQGGLLDVAIDPGYETNRLVYLSFSEAGDGGVGTAVARGRLDRNALIDVEVIFRAEPKLRGRRHFGSRLLFAPDGTLLVTLGDRGSRDRVQDTSNHLGAVVRINPDGSVPGDNPAIAGRKARPEVYTWGHRNVQGIALDGATGRVYAQEHGPQGGDEINLLAPGTNYGWPVITYGANYGSGTRIGEGTSKAGMAQPIHQWTPSIAPSGLAFYDGDRFPRWRGNLFAGALKFRLLSRLELDAGRVVHEERLLEDALGRVRAVRVGPDGLIYLLSDARTGVLARIEPAG